MARVTASGPFSKFSGTDRVLAVLEGTMNLQVADRPEIRLSAQSPAHRFAGDAAAHAEVIEPVTDLNVMVRRDKFSAEVRKLQVSQVAANHGETLVLLRCNVSLSSGENLVCNDVLHLAALERVAFDEIPSDAWLIQITPQPSAAVGS